MSTIHVNLIGRFGNQMFQYAHARARAERDGMQLAYSYWIGQDIFDLPSSVSDTWGIDDNTVSGYCQDQASLIYTRKQVKEWFRFKPEMLDRLSVLERCSQVAHRRVGDYASLGYVVVSKDSYWKAARELGYDPNYVLMITEENPTSIDGLPVLLPDFDMMINADVLFRGNSTFSWWAATLGNARVYSPVIEGLEGGREQDCRFVEGNWPRFANLPFVTDLHLEEG